ncbi:MAG: ribosome small subunit-dependent GTPase A, partial [Methylococcales bacterium]
DQYLVICENTGFRPLLICNKGDLASQSELMDQALELYQSIGYTILRVSAKSGFGLETLKLELNGQTSLLAGQSGVGKSTLTNVLIPDRNQRTAQLSQGTLRGKHTTTTSTLFHLPGGGDLIDSPGVAIFGLAETNEQDLAYGYREFQPFLGHCRFKDCRHINDAGCAIRLAVEKGPISPQRYGRFIRLREKLPQ